MFGDRPTCHRTAAPDDRTASDEYMRAVLNAGHRRGPMVGRVDKQPDATTPSPGAAADAAKHRPGAA